MDERQKKQHQERVEILLSLSFHSIAKEVNAKRLHRLRKKLAGPLTEKERRHKRKVLELFQTGELNELPSYLRADPDRMKRTLLAIYEELALVGFDKSVKAEWIAERMGFGEDTARRGFRDLEDGYLIAIDRRPRPRNQGGDGPSGYMLAWATLRDVVSKLGKQGLLWLFEEQHVLDGSADSVGAEAYRLEGLSRQNQSGTCAGPRVGAPPSHTA